MYVVSDLPWIDVCLISWTCLPEINCIFPLSVHVASCGLTAIEDSA